MSDVKSQIKVSARVRATLVVDSICSDPHWAYRDALIDRITREIETARILGTKRHGGDVDPVGVPR